MARLKTYGSKQKEASRSTLQQYPMFLPHSDWQTPIDFPNLSHCSLLALDTETRDPDLTTMGPGFLRNDASIKGFSVATEDTAWFYPLFYAEDNYHDPSAALAWLKDICAKPTEKVFHNALYDVEALNSVGITVNGVWRDTMVTEALLNETLSVSLDATAQRRLGGATKDESLLTEAAAAYGINPKSEMYLLPGRFVGPYGERDSLLLPNVLREQLKIIKANNMWTVFDLESRLLKTTWAMRKNGVRVDLERAHQLDVEWKAIMLNALVSMKEFVPFEVDIWAPKSLVKMCEYLKIDYKRTAAGNPSFENAWFQSHEHPVFKYLAIARNYDKNRRDFLEGQIFKYEIKGRIHAQFLTTRRDEGGTRSGRFSAANPNPQQTPGRDELFGPAIRGLYLPDDGAKWGKFDYSSQEPRITLHLANVAGIASANEFVSKYRDNPKFCQHTYAANVLGISRKVCKDINLGLTYGMGVPKLSYKLGVDMDEAARLRRAYSEALPFVEKVAQHYTTLAEKHGFVETLLGRRSWFQDAEVAFAYKGLNRAVQGSGADLIKLAMVEIHEQLGAVPLLTVHDEVDYNIYEEEHAYMISDIMEHAIDMTVPQYVEPELFNSWGGGE